MSQNIFKNAGKDIPAGLVVFLVAVPLCLGIALASGAPMFSGLIAGIVGGIVIGAISNSPLSVSGPAAGLAALVLGAITALNGNFSFFLCAVVIAGLFQILIGVFKLGGIANYVPNGVIKGMLTSIGILIIAKQIPHAFGYDKDDKGNITELFPFGNEDWHELLLPLQHIEVGVTVVTLLSIGIMLFWDNSALKKKLPFIPGALLAVVLAVVLNQFWEANYTVMAIENEHLVKVPVATSSSEFFNFFTLPDFKGFADPTVWIYGIIIAVIASLETLLSIEAIDNMDPEKRETNSNREMIAQGVGNTISGLIGGLPVTSVIVRSSANVNAGAKSKFSAIFHGFLLLVSVIAIPFLLNKIPLAALAAILLITGFKLANLKVFTGAFQQGKEYFLPFITTVAVILLIDLFNPYNFAHPEAKKSLADGANPILALFYYIKGKGLIIGVFVGLLVSFALKPKTEKPISILK